MRKNKKKKRSRSTSLSDIPNPLLDKQEAFLNSLTPFERGEFFSPKISTDRRAQAWMEQADIGEELVNRYSWATPNETALRILREFSPLVEIGCGANAYWCQMMKKAGIDIVGYDVNRTTGGKINGNSKSSSSGADMPLGAMSGGPEVLMRDELHGRTLFLCYPDEEDVEEFEENPTSMGAKCLELYSGKYIIHVGELFIDNTLSVDQAPYGRSSSPEFQLRLAAEFHCLLKYQLPNWVHVRDSISVWKRTETSTMVFAAEDSDDKDEEMEYRHIPTEEQLPVNLAAPCLEHLLRRAPTRTNDGPARNDAYSSPW